MATDSNNDGAKCVPCQAVKTITRAVALCTECREWYCFECSAQHQRRKVTSTHTQAYLDTPNNISYYEINCDDYLESHKRERARTVCVECRAFLCSECYSYHHKTKATMDHSVINLATEGSGSDLASKLEDSSSAEDDRTSVRGIKSTRVGPAPSSKQVRIRHDIWAPLKAANSIRSRDKQNIGRPPTGACSTQFWVRQTDTSTHTSRDWGNLETGKCTARSTTCTSQDNGMVTMTASFPAASYCPTPVQVKEDIWTPRTVAKNMHFFSRLPTDVQQGVCDVQEMVALADDRVVVLDRNNHKLKLFSPEYSCNGYVHTPVAPVGLTVVDQTTVATCTPSGRITLYRVQTHTLDVSNTFQSRVKDGGWWQDISYSSNNFVCLVDHPKTSERSVEIVTVSGQMKSVVREKGRFTSGHRVKTGDGDCFYVTSDNPDEVRCFTLDGQHIWSVDTPSPEGIALVRGQLYVVLCNKHHVCRISPDGKIYDDNNIIYTRSAYPYSLCYQQQRHRLLVSRYIPEPLIQVIGLSEVDY